MPSDRIRPVNVPLIGLRDNFLPRDHPEPTREIGWFRATTRDGAEVVNIHDLILSIGTSQEPRGRHWSILEHWMNLLVE